jgi:hypothetical protein
MRRVPADCFLLRAVSGGGAIGSLVDDVSALADDASSIC